MSKPLPKVMLHIGINKENYVEKLMPVKEIGQNAKVCPSISLIYAIFNIFSVTHLASFYSVYKRIQTVLG